ncbi:hypothetical protein RJ640_027581 [Escallonia rubra]|uniref:Reverse transcriptase Ty1/copia-type domain-containing protein n=1 Tax=Escallonia rubra TaxID=112253 RepID=A0AA88UG38_9ASTE|nr:hypothetical protein RJ640_027581 [Escallonia rubra]
MESPTTSHLKVAKRILRYIKGTLDYGIMYSSSQDFKLFGYCDSDWAGDKDDRKSTTGFVFFMGNSAFTWNSKKRPIVTLSTCEAEYVAATSCVCHAIWLRSLLMELQQTQDGPTKILVDKKSALDLAKNPVFHERSKHIDTKYHFIRECVSTKEVKLEYVKSQDQVADIFTKPLKIDVFHKLQMSLGVMNQINKSGDIFFVCMYVDDLILTGNNPKMFEEFKEEMAREFEMTNIGLMSYYLGIEVRQREDDIFISQDAYAKVILKRYGMVYCKPVKTPVECEVKLSKHGEGDKIHPTFSKSLVGSLRYLTCTRPDILFDVGLMSRYMEAPTTSHLKVAKKILRYIKGTLDYGIMYSSSQDFKLVGYCDSDWAGDKDDRKSTTEFVFFMGNSAFTWNSKKQPIVTMSTCEAEYVVATSCVCHAIWLRSLLMELQQTQDGPTKILVDKKSALDLAKNPVFHERSKHIDTKYHFIRVCVSTKEVKLEYVKSQDQVADIFTKPLKIDVFHKLQMSLGVMNQV